MDSGLRTDSPLHVLATYFVQLFAEPFLREIGTHGDERCASARGGGGQREASRPVPDGRSKEPLDCEIRAQAASRCPRVGLAPVGCGHGGRKDGCSTLLLNRLRSRRKRGLVGM